MLFLCKLRNEGERFSVTRVVYNRQLIIGDLKVGC